jgi:hypothetical protein
MGLSRTLEDALGTLMWAAIGVCYVLASAPVAVSLPLGVALGILVAHLIGP